MKDNVFKVYFSRERQLASREKGKAAIIYPENDQWNDFTFKTRFWLSAFINDEEVLNCRIRFSFLSPDKAPKQRIYEALESSKKHVILAKEIDEFFTMQSDMGSYRRIVDALGSNGAKELLISLNDLVALKETRRKPKWYESAIKSDAFSFSFIRETESFFAFHNAYSILNGLSQETIGKISESLSVRFKLPSFLKEHEINFQFKRNQLLPQNIAVIIGKNGIGKSQTLNNIVRSALAGDDGLTDQNGNRPLISSIIAIAAPGETGRTFPRQQNGKRIPYKKFSLGRNNKNLRTEGLGDLLVQLARSNQYIAGQERWGLFIQAIETSIKIDNIVLPHSKNWQDDETINDSYTKLFSFKQRMGEERFLEACQKIDKKADPVILTDGKFLPLSSGQITFINFLATLCLYVENGTLVLLDEPETHLHPNLIADLVSMLNMVLELTGSIAIVATHSVYFVREVPRNQVFILKETSPRIITTENPRLKTIGAEVGSISHFIFNDDTSAHFINKIVGQLKKRPDKKEEIERLRGEIPSEAMMKILREIG